MILNLGKPSRRYVGQQEELLFNGVLYDQWASFLAQLHRRKYSISLCRMEIFFIFFKCEETLFERMII